MVSVIFLIFAVVKQNRLRVMIEIEKRIYVSENLFKNEYSYLYGVDKNKLVNFIYYNWKKDKEGTPIQWKYKDALSLARSRARDGRYKNYEFLITL